MSKTASTSSDAKPTEDELKIVHERLMAALKASRCGTWRWDIANDVVEWDEALSMVYGIDHSTAPKTSRDFFSLIHPEDLERIGSHITERLKDGGELGYEFRAVIGDKIKWIYDRSVISRDQSGNALYVTGACIDVTERKKIEDERTTALERQRILLSELNHRTKNHLQMITALLSMQASRQPDASAKADFQNAIQRIQTIADLHGQLYSDDWLGRVSMGPYLEGICENLRRAIVQKDIISLDCKVEAMTLPVDQALPIGLIVNELVTNSVKYAFPNKREGKILVRLHERNGRISFVVSDDGVGMSEESTKAKRGIGRRLVQSLAKQIGGRMRLRQKNGVSYHLLFRTGCVDEHAKS